MASIAVLVALFCLAFVALQIRSRLGGTRIYDMRLVDEKTARPAYRVRLRLFVFSSGEETIPAHDAQLKEIVQCTFTWQQFTWSSLHTSFQRWRKEVVRNKQRKQAQWDVLAHLVAAYRQYHTASGGYFVPHRLSQGKVRRLLVRQRGGMHSSFGGWEHGLARSPHLLSVADIAALWHLPQSQDLADLPYVERTRARTALVPAELTQGQGWKIGTSSHAGHTVPVYLPQECLRHNLLAVASTGKGKSTLFEHLAQAVCAIRSDSRHTTDPGLAFIEPHGDVVHALCGLVPPSRGGATWC
jgi:hypothetical protein